MERDHEGEQDPSGAQGTHTHQKARELGCWLTHRRILRRYDDKDNDDTYLPGAAGETPIPRVEEVAVHHPCHVQQWEAEEHLQSMHYTEHE